MSHEVESMFSVREVPWHYEMTKDVTKIIQSAPNSEEGQGKRWKDGKIERWKDYRA